MLILLHLPAGIHPTTISDSIQLATEHAVEVLTAMSSPLSLSDRDSLLKSATTSLSSKVMCACHIEYTLYFYMCIWLCTFPCVLALLGMHSIIIDNNSEWDF